MIYLRQTGVTSLNVTSGVKKQADNSSQKTYSLVDVNGGGKLVAVLKEASRLNDFAEVDNKIREIVEPFLYNKGQGKFIPISELVLIRNQDRPRNKQLSPPKTLNQDSNGAGQNCNSDGTNLRGNGTPAGNTKNPEMYREVCWDLYERGSVGETALHLCLLVSSTIHAELAKRLVKLYPKLVNDIYLNDEYYGENVLHMAIVNEDPAMVKYLVDHGANYHERCIGNFFCPEDQKASRMDSLDHEAVDVTAKTNYEGYVYWGEYPLSFAACLEQEECYRLLLAKGADPTRQDTNLNTVMHLMVIYEKVEMFNTAYELGASINIINRQGLTPLTLAAKLARKEMFFHILKIQREIYWQLGNITCAAYPLEEIDTINNRTGEINKVSALNLVVYGDNFTHLEMLEGLLVDLLNAKWNSFVKFRFYRQFATFLVYFTISIVCFVLRPGPLVVKQRGIDLTFNTSVEVGKFTFMIDNTTVDNDTTIDDCYLLNRNRNDEVLRLVLEGLLAVGAFLYLLNSVLEARFLGYQTFAQNMMTVPSRVLFLVSCTFVLLMIPLRLTCSCWAEDIVAVFVMITTAPYFLFFCRGFKLVGPFVVMIYKMIMTDLLRFVTIYLVFVMGFSQGNNFFKTPLYSVMAMFVMSLSEFGEMYQAFEHTAHPMTAKILFIMYMALVTILLINMLIAMMGKTYQDIAERRNEWMRQWARIILVVERGVPPSECLDHLIQYSQTMADGRRALVLRLHHNEQEMEEMRELGELKTKHLENKRRQEAGSKVLSPRLNHRIQ
ncbi:transient receptor potential cation channel subfamily V member 5-like isoform X2 [Tachypleus tridentatus]|uniref:transient receptor potential cation channel subfamily V member 5-like isoform X2 n=1 Tax=Tachypleus tridentatus TaxID=6853 RepID=UPI003FD0B176